MTSVDGELLTPTLTDHRPRDWTGRLPWRLGALVYPSILGGPVAATIVAVVNGRRLRVESRALIVLGVVGAFAFAGATAIGLAVDGDAPRVLLALLGLIVYGVAYVFQRTADRIHSTFSPHDDPEDDYDAFFVPAVAAILVGWTVQIAAIVLLGGGG